MFSHTDKPACYVCGNVDLKKKFVLPLTDGPYRHSLHVKRRTIYDCGLCGHLSADSYDPQLYADYYSALSHDYHLDHDKDICRYAQIRDLICDGPVRRVLDIGCGTGTFLSMLPNRIECFGIEPSRIAADYARQGGIKIIQYQDLYQPSLRNTFDVVTAIDVAEHTVDLIQFRECLAAALRPGGLLILLTGDSERLVARALGPYWYYLNFSEHVSFFSPRSMRTWLSPNFSPVDITPANHHPLSTRETLSVVRGWFLFPFKWGLRKWLSEKVKCQAMLWLPQDHMLVRAVRL